MSVIDIRTFGGESPRTPPRNLPAGMAQVASNLLATAAEFRPLPGELVVSTLPFSNPKTIRRFTKTLAGHPDITDFTASWGASPELLSLAKGQINDDLTERTYLTSETTLPQVFDNTGFSKVLGVPPPPMLTVAANVTGEYSYDEDARARERIPREMLAALRASATVQMIGAAPALVAGGATQGWLSHSGAVAAGMTVTQFDGDFVFLTPMNVDGNGEATSITDAALTYLTATEFGGSEVAYQGGRQWAVPLTMQGTGFVVDGVALTAKFKAVQTPDPDTVRAVGADFDSTTQQFTNTAIAQSVAEIVAEYSQANPAIEPSVRKLASARRAAEQSLTNYENQSALAASITAFYSKTDVAAEITAAIATFAQAVVAAEASILAPPYEQQY